MHYFWHLEDMYFLYQLIDRLVGEPSVYDHRKSYMGLHDSDFYSDL